MIAPASFEITATRFAVLIAHDACARCTQLTPVSSLLINVFQANLDGYMLPVTGAAQLVDIESLNLDAQHEWQSRAPWIRRAPRILGRPGLLANSCVRCGHETIESERTQGALGSANESVGRGVMFNWVDAPLRAFARFDTAPWMERLAARHTGRGMLRALVEQEPHRAAA